MNKQEKKENWEEFEAYAAEKDIDIYTADIEEVCTLYHRYCILKSF